MKFNHGNALSSISVHVFPNFAIAILLLSFNVFYMINFSYCLILYYLCRSFFMCSLYMNLTLQLPKQSL